MSILSEAIGPVVGPWREHGYEGVTDTTRRLLEHWFFEQHWLDIAEPFEFWDCQREAIETLIYVYEVAGCRSLYEMGRTFDAAVRVHATEDNWPAYCFKMATGSGKTFVMAMAIVWQYFNAIREDNETDYTTDFMLVAPNIIVLDRLLEGFAEGGVLREFPFFVPGEWQSEFELQVIKQDEDVPPHSRGIVHITNVHRFYDRPERQDDNPIQELLGPRPVAGEELLSRIRLKEILSRYDRIAVMNDEAHHAHIDTEWNEALKEIDGNDTTIELQLDFTATAWDIARDQEVPLPHIIYDYPLKRALKDNIVKEPHIATIQDAPQPVSDDFVAQYKAEIHTAHKYLQDVKKALGEVGKKPVLFAMCDNTKHADEVAEYFTNELGYGHKVLLIHTYVRGGRYGGPGDVKADVLEEVREAARNIDTNEYEVIVSVLMLKEGWDVRNVCVLLPMRAFGSDILVEQTLGRGLRRMFPHDDDAEDNLYVIEHAAFRDLWQEKIEQGELPIAIGPATGAEEATLVKVDNSKLEYDLTIPLVRGGITKRVPDISELDITDLTSAVMVLEEVEVLEPKVIERRLRDMKVTREEIVDFDYAPTPQDYFAWLTKHALKHAGSSSQFHELFPIVRDYMTERFFAAQIEEFDEVTMKRLNSPAVRGRVGAELVNALRGLSVVEEDYQMLREWLLSATESFLTRTPVYRARKTVFNCLPYQATTTYESEFMRYLDGQPQVIAFAKFMRRFPIRISYVHPEGGVRRYVPDYVVKTEAAMYLIETKGEIWGQLPEVPQKDAAARAWCGNASEMSETQWHFRRTQQRVFDQHRGSSFENLMALSEYAR